MYLAQFTTEVGSFFTAALTWQASGAVVPHRWLSRLLALDAVGDIDIALRVVPAPEGITAVLLLTADVASGPALRAQCAALLDGGPAELRVPEDPGEFDEMAGLANARHVRVAHEGFHHRDQPIACDFRLYPTYLSRPVQDDTIYQVHVRSHRPTADLERRARKHLAWLELEKPFSEPVRAMQAALVERARLSGWHACEFLIFRREANAAAMVDRMQRHFDATTGRIGFPAAPLEEGDFTEWLSTGCHPAREATSPPSLPCVGATVFYGDELERLFKTVLVPSGQSVSAASARDVFVSYSSGDFAQASAICDHLERRGVTCWIAPRDIDRGVLSYPEAIQDGIAHARAILVVLSATANLSVHMPREVDLALEGRLVIVPVRLDDVEPQGQLKYLLRTVQRTDMRPHTFSQSMEIILTRLQHATA